MKYFSNLSRAQALVLWACLAVTMAVLVYPPVCKSQWNDQDERWESANLIGYSYQMYEVVPRRGVYDSKYQARTVKINRLYVLTLLEYAHGNSSGPGLSIPGLAIELALIALIGGGLIKVLGAGSQGQTPP